MHDVIQMFRTENTINNAERVLFSFCIFLNMFTAGHSLVTDARRAVLEHCGARVGVRLDVGLAYDDVLDPFVHFGSISFELLSSIVDETYGDGLG